MASRPSHPYTILAAIDYSETASLVVQEAVDLARESMLQRSISCTCTPGPWTTQGKRLGTPSCWSGSARGSRAARVSRPQPRSSDMK